MEDSARPMKTTASPDQTEWAVIDTFNLAGEVVRLFRSQCDRELRSVGSGMTAAGAAIIMELEMHPGLSQVHLAKAIGTTQMTIVRLLDRLERLGWVRPGHGSAHRRTPAPSLTPAGKEVIPKVRAGRRKVLGRITSYCGTIDPQVTEVLEKLKEGLLL